MSQAPIGAVDICNLALDALGQSPIVNVVNPGTDVVANICARWYDQTRRQLLREFIFNFARKVILMQPNTKAPPHPEFVNGYSLPNDLVRMLKLGDRYLFAGAIPSWAMDFSNGFLYCDQTTDPQNIASDPAQAAPELTITAIYRTGETVSGVVVPAGFTVVALAVGQQPIDGAYYTASAVQGTVQANGQNFQVVPGTLGAAGPVYFLQTAGGQNFDSSTWTPYISGGVLAPAYVPPYSDSALTTNLQLTYIFDAQVVQTFDPLFINVFAFQLAKNMAFKFTLKPSVKQQLEEDLKQARIAAAAVAGQERPPVRVQRSRIVRVRRSGGIFSDNTRVYGSY
jgi:hypothetical protein